MIRGKSTFLEGDLPSDIDDIMGYGLMQSTECYNPSLSRRHRAQSVKFYPGIQEYLAFKCIAGLSIEILVEIFQGVASMLVTIDLRMQLFDMWVFVFSIISKPIRKILFSEVLQSFDLMDSPINQETSIVTVLNKTDQVYLNVLHKYLCSNQKVNLGGNNLTAASSSLICDIVNCVKPSSLELSCNYLMDISIADICATIKNNESLKHLHLAEIGISSVTV